MGGNGLASNSRNKSQNIDRISILPEVILSYILSLLPTRDAVRTSVLSRTWKRRWTTINILDFDDRLHNPDKKHRPNFVDFVDKVYLHLGNSRIQDIYLSCFDANNLPRIRPWVIEAIRREVRGIHVRGNADKPLIFPQGMYDRDSLQELILKIHCIFVVPASTCFSSIKFLDLTRAAFVNKSSRSAEICLSFPVLEVLILERCSFVRTDVVNIDAPLLNSFTLIDSAYRPKKPVESCVLKINGSSLTTLNWSMYSYVSLILVNPSSVVNANIRLSSLLDLDHKLKMSFVTGDLLNQVAYVRYLTLSYGSIEVLSCIEGLEDRLPIFSNLIKLSIDLEFPAYSGILTALLKSMPILETLIFTLGTSDKVEGEMVPICSLPSLKVIKLMHFHGRKMDIELVKVLIKNAIVLEVLIIVASEEFSSKGRNKFKAMKKQIQAFPRGSADLSIFFI